MKTLEKLYDSIYMETLGHRSDPFFAIIFCRSDYKSTGSLYSQLMTC